MTNTSQSPKESDTRLLTKLSTFIGAHLKGLDMELTCKGAPLENPSEEYVRIAKLVLNGINFVSGTYLTEFVIWIYHGKYSPTEMPANKMFLPSIVSNMPLHMGDRIMLDPELNSRWQMTIGQIGNFPYGGERVIPIIVVVKDEKEEQELVNKVSVLFGSNRQEESLQSQMDSEESAQTPPPSE